MFFRRKLLIITSRVVVWVILFLFIMLLTHGTEAQGSFSCTAVSQIPQTECEALVAFYNSANGARWRENSNWLVTQTPCNWFGIHCAGGQVTELILEDNQLSGTLPSEIGNFSRLDRLLLSANQLGGTIPPELGNLTHLRILILQLNQFTGAIPPQLGNLTNLQFFILFNNQMSGSLPLELGQLTEVEIFSVAHNDFAGDFPAEIGTLTKATWIDVSHTDLSGSLPLTLTNLQNVSTFKFNETGLCEPTDPAFHTWLQSVASVDGTGVPCTTLTINHATGAPGSFFLLTGAGFPTNETANIMVNGRSLGTVPTDENGRFALTLTTEIADNGTYFATARVNPSATVKFILNANAPRHPRIGDATLLAVPTGIAFTHFYSLPVIFK